MNEDIDLEPVLEAVELWIMGIIRVAVQPNWGDPSMTAHDPRITELKLARQNLLRQLEMLNDSSPPPHTS